MTHIGGQKADDNDNDPVEVRKYQIIGGGLDEALGRFPTTNIRYRSLPGTGYIFWQYFPNGIIISTPNSCVCVLYGPLYEYWDRTGQFDGPLGAPTTDVLHLPGAPSTPGRPPPPPTASYAVFENGVLYLDPTVGSVVEELSPVLAGMITSGTGITPTGAGIAQAVQATIQGFAATAWATNQRLRDNVESISARVTFHSTGLGGCSGASFDGVGRSLLRTHILNVHFDFDLKGCAGSFGDASAELRVEVRLFIDPPRVTARLVRYWIDSVSSPFGAGDHDIRQGLTQSLNGQFGHDLLRRTIPAGITVLAGIVMVNGDVNLYIAPICATSKVLMQTAGPGAADTLDQLRHLRDDHLVHRPNGPELVHVVDAFGPVVTEALRRQSDAEDLREALAGLLTRTFADGPDLDGLVDQLDDAFGDLATLLSLQSHQDDPRWPERLTDRGIDVLRSQLREQVPFDVVVAAGREVIHEEIRSCREGDGDRGSPG